MLNTNAAILASLGGRIRRERLVRDLTQASLADRAGVSLRTLQKVEGGSSCSTDTLVSILRALGHLDQINALLPDSGPSPIQLADMRGRERRRASGTRERSRDEAAEDWSW